MSDFEPRPGMIKLSDAKSFLARTLGSSPDEEILIEWIRLGYLTGEQIGKDYHIAENSLQSLVDQLDKLENKRGSRLALHAVDVWRRNTDLRAVAVTLSTKSTVVTREELCKDNDEALLEAAVRATLAAISEAVLSSLELKFIKVKHHSLPNIEQSMVAVLISTGEEENQLTLSGVAMTARSSSPLEAAARATLNALNRTISPFLNEERSWRDLVKRLLPV